MADVKRRPGESTAAWRARADLARRAAGQSPGQAQADRGYTDAELKAAQDQYRRSRGVGGLGGAAKANEAKFQAAEKKYLDEWKRKKREAAAKKRAQKKAAKKLPPTP
jgi:hypothetical protein